MKSVHNAEEIANWFLAWAEVEEEKVTKISIQKLLYFSQSHYLSDFRVPLFDEEIQAWDNGPVVKNVWEKYKSEENGKPIFLKDDFDFSHFSDEENDFLIEIWNTYGTLAENHLINKTHKEITWKWNYNVNESHHQNVISKNFMMNYYDLREMAA